MTKQTIIPAGYRITVVSWENDGDNYNTKVSEGWTKEEVAFLVPFIKVVTAHLGNEYDPDDEQKDEVADIVEALVEKNPAIHLSERLKDYFRLATEEEKEDEYYSRLDGSSELLYDFVGGSEYYWTRVCESIKVEYIPNEIILQDVTEEFA